MKTINYSVNTFGFQYHIEIFQDEGYFSDSGMSQNLISDEHLKMDFVSFDRREEKSGRLTEKQAEKASLRSACAKYISLATHATDKIISKEKSLPKVKFKRTTNSLENNLKLIKRKSFKKMSPQLPPDTGYKDQLQFKISNYILDFNDCSEKSQDCGSSMKKEVCSLPLLVKNQRSILTKDQGSLHSGAIVGQIPTHSIVGQIPTHSWPKTKVHCNQMQLLAKYQRPKSNTQVDKNERLNLSENRFSVENDCLCSSEDKSNMKIGSSPVDKYLSDLSNFEFKETELNWYDECERQEDGKKLTFSPSTASSSSSSSSSSLSLTKTQKPDQFEVDKSSGINMKCPDFDKSPFDGHINSGEHKNLNSNAALLPMQCNGQRLTGKLSHLASHLGDEPRTFGHLVSKVGYEPTLVSKLVNRPEPQPNTLMFGSSILGAGGMRRSPPPAKESENRNPNGGDDTGSGNTGGVGNTGGGSGETNRSHFQSNPGDSQLVIKIDPAKFSVLDPEQQTDSNCKEPFLKYYRTLFDKVVSLPSYDWFNDEEVQQFFASAVIRCGRKLIPASITNHDYDDFFNYDRNNNLSLSNLTTATSNVLSGVDSEDPSNFFTPFDHLERVDQPDEVALRPGIVLMCNLIQDLAIKGIRVQVEYRFGNDENGDQRLVIYEDAFLKGTLKDAFYEVKDCLHQIFLLQSKASQLADAIESVSDKTLDEIEELLGNYVLVREPLDLETLKRAGKHLNQALARLRKQTRDYETVCMVTYDDSSLTSGHATRQFQNQNNLINFLRNNSDADFNWSRTPAKWTSVRPQCQVRNSSLKITASPSRLYITRATGGFDDLISKVKAMVDRIMDEVSKNNHTSTTSDPPPSVRDPSASHGRDETASITRNVIKDAHSFLNLMESVNLKQQSMQALESHQRTSIDINRELQQLQWKSGVTLSKEERELQQNVQSTTTYIAEIIKNKQDIQKVQDIEQRELSKSISSAKAPHLDKQGKNIQAFLEFHMTFKKANPLSRCIKLREGLHDDLKQRVLHETDPEAILSLLKKMYLAEDVLLPMSRQEIADLKSTPVVNSKDEAKAYSIILGFITKLQKADLLERFDFSTIQMASSKLSKVRLDAWEKEWMITQERLEADGESLRVQESRKRELFIRFLKLHEGLLHRRLLQSSIDDKDKPDKKEKREKVFNTKELRPTRFDKRTNKKDDKTNKDKEKDKAYNCVLCKQKDGHPRTFPASKKGTGQRSLARCPTFRSTEQSKKLSLATSLNSCVRCLSTTHTVDSCFLNPTTSWLLHDCENGKNGHHAPSVCPKQQADSRQERANKTETSVKESLSHQNFAPVNLVESIEAKTLPSSSAITIRICYDNCSDSNWISQSFAQTLPQRKRKRVKLFLSTIPSRKIFETWEFPMFIKVKGKFVQIKVYEASGELGNFSITDSVKQELRSYFNLPIELYTGKIHMMLGLKNFGFHPKLVSHEASSKIPDMKLFSSSTSEKPKYIVAGVLPTASQGTAVREEEANFTTSQLYQSLLQDKGLDHPPLQCQECKLRSKRCYRCSLLTKPISVQDQREIELITSPMVFNRQKGQVTTYYIPTTEQPFNTIFPPHLSNQREATAISKRILRSMKKEGLVDAFEEALSKFVDQGVFKYTSLEELREYDSRGLPSNFVSVQGVKKAQSDPTKLALRLVTNSSLPRKAIIQGKEVKISLNNILPKAKPVMNSLVNVSLKWIEKPVSVILDQKRAYHTIKAEDSEQGLIMTHLRRIAWFENPHDNEEDLRVRYFRVIPVQFGDSPAAAILDCFREKVVKDLKDNNQETSADLLSSSSFVDDNALSVETYSQAATFCKETIKAFATYNAELHEPLICDKNGKYDSNGIPHNEPGPNEEAESRIFGFFYNVFKDEIRLPIQRNINHKKRGIRVGQDLLPGEVKNLQLTMRMMSSFQMSLHDFMGFMSILTVRGKILLSKIQEVLPPSTAAFWDQVLPQELLEEGRQYIKMMIEADDPIFKRSPPPGILKELHCHVDGAKDCYAIVIWGLFINDSGDRGSKLLYSKNKVSKRTIPEQELSSMAMGSQCLCNMVKIYPSVETCHIFGDSEAVFYQTRASYKTKDVFRANKHHFIQSNLDELKDANVKVHIHLVRSAHNGADPVSKFIESSVNLIKSTTWWQGPVWMTQEQNNWPLAELPNVSQQQTISGEEVSSLPKIDCYATMERKDRVALANQRREIGKREVDIDDLEIFDMESSTSFPPLIHPSTSSHQSSNTNPSPPQIAARITGEQLTSETSCLTLETDKDKSKDLHIFSKTILNCSNVNVLIRAIARVKKVFKAKSFKVSAPDCNEESEAFETLVKMEQGVSKEKIPKSVSAGDYNGIKITSQRWSPEAHIDLFGVPHLPLLSAGSELGHLLLQSAHHLRQGACASKRHSMQRLRTGKFPAYLFGNVKARLSSIVQKCVNCLKSKKQVFSPPMKDDAFKKVNELNPWSSISVDMAGHVLVTTANRQTRGRKMFSKRYILVVCDNSGISGVNFIPMENASAASFAMALSTHCAQVNQKPSSIYSDKGSNIVCVSKFAASRQDSNNDKDTNSGDKTDDIKVTIFSEELQNQYPGVKWTQTPPDAQHRNGLAENNIFALKRFIHGIFHNKPNDTYPKFSPEGLLLILSEAKCFLNNRPITWINDSEMPLTPNHFLCVHTDPQTLTKEPLGLEDKYSVLQDYRQRIFDQLRLYMQTTKFLPGRWFEAGKMPEIEDVCINVRQKSKFSPGNMEYCKIEHLSDDKRTAKIKVVRGNQQKLSEVDVRNLILIFRQNCESKK